MIIEIALGLVLGVFLLALIPIIIVGSVAALRWLLPVAVAATAVWLITLSPVKVLGTAGIAVLLLALVTGWQLLSGRLVHMNSRLAKELSSLHSNYFALLDNRAPYQGTKWLPLRIAAVFVAILTTGALAASALLALDILWKGGA
jgi:hypothetical protein